jgi:hypothetical protein
MDIYSLAQRLRDPDPRVRVETLRILAMVEETQALAAIWWIYKNDPVQGVREVARWAGSLIWQAQQRGHSTQRAVEEMFNRSFAPERQAEFLERQAFNMPETRHRTIRRFAVEHEYQRRLDKALRVENDQPEEEDVLPALSPPVPPQQAAEPPEEDDWDSLLDAGLTNPLE